MEPSAPLGASLGATFEQPRTIFLEGRAMLPYKCLFVDWHLTLSTSGFWQQFSPPQHPQHALFTTMQAKLFAPAQAQAWVIPWMRGVLSSEEVIDGVCQGTAISPAFALEALRVSCQQMRPVSDAVPQMIADLRSRGLKVVIATDNMDTFPRWTVPSLRLGTLFDDMLCSSDLGALKEDADQDGQSRFFASYARAQGLGPGESLLVDDGEEDFGAVIRQFGIDYLHSEPGKGLVPALRGLLASLSF